MDSATARLNRLDSCAVSDALDKLGLPGAVPGLRPFAVRRSIAGRVRTVRLGPADHRAGTVHLAAKAIDGAMAGDIIVVEQRTGVEAACWGGILTLAAKLRGVAGVIAEGPVRDIDEARAHEFPVYARGLTTRTARGRVMEVEDGGVIVVGEVTVKAGDYAIADGSGVVFIAATDVDRVLTAAEEIAAREKAIAKALMEGRPATEAMGANYERMLDDQPA